MNNENMHSDFLESWRASGNGTSFF
jgi:hypothetical protein